MTEASAERPPNILIVDDTPENLRLLSQMLTERGYQVRATVSGERALEAAQAHVPDLILLDIMMPAMDGYEVCQQLKASEPTRDVPILFISALNQTEDKVKAFAAGGVDYITKPFQVQEVLARVRTHLTLHRLSRQIQSVNRELERQVKELQARNEDLDAFAHTVAHDIKNPISQVIGYSQLLREYYDSLPPQDRDKSLRALHQIGVKLNNILDELLLLAQVRKAEVKLQVLDMGKIVSEARKRLAAVIEERHAEIVLPAQWPAALGYGPWVEEVWVNYLSNGCKYGGTPPRLELGATPLLTSPPQAWETERGYVHFWVRDNGAGLTPEARVRLFKPFTRFDQVRTHGYGLGLSIVRRIVERLGGQVSADSEGIPGRGSVFGFTLPRAPD